MSNNGQMTILGNIAVPGGWNGQAGGAGGAGSLIGGMAGAIGNSLGSLAGGLGGYSGGGSGIANMNNIAIPPLSEPLQEMVEVGLLLQSNKKSIQEKFQCFLKCLSIKEVQELLNNKEDIENDIERHILLNA